MAKFNIAQPKIHMGHFHTTTSSYPDTTSYEGTPAYTRDAKSELFIAAVSSFLEDSFYESGDANTRRIQNLTEKVAVEDPTWIRQFVTWLRGDAGMRSASTLVAVAGAHGLLKAKIPGARQIINFSILRADEPGEVLAAWRSLYGRTLPSAVKRGINDAINRVWGEYSVLKYGGKSKGYSFADVMNLTRPKMDNQALGTYIMEKSYGRDFSSEELPMIEARSYFDSLGPGAQRTYILSGNAKNAGLTWEVVASILGKPDAEVWEALLPSMGYMAKLRSLRRLEEAGVSDDVLDILCDELADPYNVVNSRQLPLRFLSAFKQTSLRFAYPLEQALNQSLKNVPELKGNTLILLDRSGSMYYGNIGKNSSLTYGEAANLFAASLALRAEKADLVAFASHCVRVPFYKGSQSVLQLANQKTSVDGGGTFLRDALNSSYNNHDRVVVLTDEQSHYSYTGNLENTSTIPDHVPMYTFNLAGYKSAFAASGLNRYTFGGLNDQGFKTIEWVESGKDQKYPWEMNNS